MGAHPPSLLPWSVEAPVLSAWQKEASETRWFIQALGEQGGGLGVVSGAAREDDRGAGFLVLVLWVLLFYSAGEPPTVDLG